MTITTTYTQTQIKQLKTFLSKGEVRKTPPYAIFQIKMSDCMITAYESGKVVFQGEGADFYASMLPSSTSNRTSTPTPKASTIESFPQAGSDEVGTGDYFGPVVVCATYIDEESLSFLNTLQIRDSKQIKDDDIINIAPQLIAHIPHSILILENIKYNQVHKDYNMNGIKAMLHNKAFLNLKQKLNHDIDTIYIDQFTPPTSYFRYLKNEPDVVRNIHFETKAEDKFISVACASMIARYYFLEAMDKMSEHYHFPFPKGAGNHVDEKGREFVDEFGEKELYRVSKVHFKNTERILNLEKE